MLPSAKNLSRPVTVIEFQDKMPWNRKMADELLLGLFYDPQDLCTYNFTDLDFDFELNDEKFELGNQDADADTRPSYMSLIDLNGEFDFPDFWEEEEKDDGVLENPGDDEDGSWSIDVNFDGSEAHDLESMRSGSSFNFLSFVAWLDTGQKMLDVLRKLWALCWDIMKFVFGSGNKESFEC